MLLEYWHKRVAGASGGTVLSEALWGLAAAGGTAIVGVMATDAWRSVRLRFAGLLGRGETVRERVEPERGESGPLARTGEDTAGAPEAEGAAEHTPPSPNCVQHNIARDGGTQYIVLSGAINLGPDNRIPR